MATENCCCRHTDARACLLARHPEIRRNSDDVGGSYDEFMDEVCDCSCHKERDPDDYEDGEREWRMNLYGPTRE